MTVKKVILKGIKMVKINYKVLIFLLPHLAYAEDVSRSVSGSYLLDNCLGKTPDPSIFALIIFLIGIIPIWWGVTKIYGYFFSLSELVQTSPFIYWLRRIAITGLISSIGSYAVTDSLLTAIYC